MRSPFPGMDPYLEHPAVWSDLHLTLIVAMRGELNAHLPKGYLAAADRHARTITLSLHERKGTPFLKIVDAQDRRVITVLELLSPANKASGPDRKAYLAKREEYLAANVNLVEINLLRGGKAPPLGKSRLPKGAYYYLVCRADEVPHGQLWTFAIRDELPPVSVPLRGEVSTMLNMRACLDRAYAEARYDEEIDYTQPPQPKLGNADGHWAETLLKGQD